MPMKLSSQASSCCESELSGQGWYGSVAGVRWLRAAGSPSANYSAADDSEFFGHYTSFIKFYRSYTTTFLFLRISILPITYNVIRFKQPLCRRQPIFMVRKTVA
jgi:hypothetical protein